MEYRLTGHVGIQTDRICWNTDRQDMLEYRQTGHVNTDMLEYRQTGHVGIQTENMLEYRQDLLEYREHVGIQTDRTKEYRQIGPVGIQTKPIVIQTDRTYWNTDKQDMF